MSDAHRTVTPAEAQALLSSVDRYVPGTDPHVAAVDRLRDGAFALAATVASEPARIAAAVAAVTSAARVALDAYLAADKALLDAIGRGEVRNEYHPLAFVRLARLDALRGALAGEVTP